MKESEQRGFRKEIGKEVIGETDNQDTQRIGGMIIRRKEGEIGLVTIHKEGEIIRQKTDIKITTKGEQKIKGYTRKRPNMQGWRAQKVTICPPRGTTTTAETMITEGGRRTDDRRIPFLEEAMTT